MSAAQVVATAIATALSGAPYLLVYGQNVRYGREMKDSESQTITTPVPDRVLFVRGTGGHQPVAFKDGNLKTRELMPTVQVMVRAAPSDFDDGEALIFAAFNAIDMTPPVGFFEARATESEPVYLGEDSENHHRWSFNVQLFGKSS